jgi:anaerobic C4-dicarboxylate transporter
MKDLLYHPSVREFVFTHPFLAWGLLAVVLSSLILGPVMWKWPKRAK